MKKALFVSALIALVVACQSNSNETQQNQPPAAPSDQNATIEPTLSAEAYRGKDLFEANCVACHGINDKVIGPALAGVNERHSEEWLLKFIRNSQKMIKEGDPMAVKLFKENNSTPMSDFERLSDQEIKDILAFVKETAK